MFHLWIFLDPADDSTVIKSLYVDNGGNFPAREFAPSSSQDSGRTYVVGTDDLTSFEFDFFYVTNAGHVAFLSGTGDEVPVTIHSFHGDYSGFIHVMEGMRVTIESSDSPFPAAFALYEGGIFRPPARKQNLQAATCIYFIH